MMNHQMYTNSWAALTVASIVSLSSLTSSFEDGDWSRDMKWTVSVTAISLALAFFSFLLRFLKKDMFSGTHWEHGAVLIVLIFWCAGLPFIMDPANEHAVNQFGMVTDANLFFSSWFAFLVVMMMVVDIFPSCVMGERVSVFADQWIFFGTASLIAMTNAVRYWKDLCDSTSEPDCARTAFGFILGAVGGLFAIIFMVFQHKVIEQMMSILFLAAWCFGVAYLTFNKGPAMFVGVYFFSVWASFLFALGMAMASFTSLHTRVMGGEEDTGAEADEATGDQPATKVAEETAKHDEEDQEKEETST